MVIKFQTGLHVNFKLLPNVCSSLGLYPNDDTKVSYYCKLLLTEICIIQCTCFIIFCYSNIS